MHVSMLGCFSCVSFFVTPCTEACQAPTYMKFSRQEYWSGLPFPSSGMNQYWYNLMDSSPYFFQIFLAFVFVLFVFFFFLIQDPIQNTMLHLSIMFLGSPGLYQFPQFNSVQFSSVQSLSRIWLFATPWITARQASLSITNSWGLLKLMSIESLMPSNHLIIIHPFLLLLPVPPSITVFSSQLFTWGGQSIGVSASASIFPTNTQDWSPLGWTGWISLSFLDLSYFKWDIG